MSCSAGSGAKLFHPLDIGIDVGLAPKPGGGHRPHGAEDRALRPWAVMQAEAPADIRIGARIATAKEVTVVEGEGGREGLLGGVGPFKDFLAPIHAHVI